MRAAKGAVKMVKVNVDQAQNIAGQLQIQSIPTVYAFYRPAGRRFPRRAAAVRDQSLRRPCGVRGGEAPGDTLADAVLPQEEMLAEGAATDAEQTFAAILEEDLMNAPAMAAWFGLTLPWAHWIRPKPC